MPESLDMDGKRMARDSFKQEALASRAEYQRTGHYLAFQEVRAWLKSWGRAEDSRPVVRDQNSANLFNPSKTP